MLALPKLLLVVVFLAVARGELINIGSSPEAARRALQRKYE